MFNGSIYYVLYLQILHFHLGRQNGRFSLWFITFDISIHDAGNHEALVIILQEFRTLPFTRPTPIFSYKVQNLISCFETL